jgi:hypothetical protein
MFGGDEEIRTLDLSDANRTLSQLSYAPKYHQPDINVVETIGLEPTTSTMPL